MSSQPGSSSVVDVASTQTTTPSTATSYNLSETIIPPSPPDSAIHLPPSSKLRRPTRSSIPSFGGFLACSDGKRSMPIGWDDGSDLDSDVEAIDAIDAATMAPTTHRHFYVTDSTPRLLVNTDRTTEVPHLNTPLSRGTHIDALSLTPPYPCMPCRDVFKAFLETNPSPSELANAPPPCYILDSDHRNTFKNVSSDWNVHDRCGNCMRTGRRCVWTTEGKEANKKERRRIEMGMGRRDLKENQERRLADDDVGDVIEYGGRVDEVSLDGEGDLPIVRDSDGLSIQVNKERSVASSGGQTNFHPSNQTTSIRSSSFRHTQDVALPSSSHSAAHKVIMPSWYTAKQMDGYQIDKRNSNYKLSVRIMEEGRRNIGSDMCENCIALASSLAPGTSNPSLEPQCYTSSSSCRCAECIPRGKVCTFRRRGDGTKLERSHNPLESDVIMGSQSQVDEAKPSSVDLMAVDEASSPDEEVILSQLFARVRERRLDSPDVQEQRDANQHPTQVLRKQEDVESSFNGFVQEHNIKDIARKMSAWEATILQNARRTAIPKPVISHQLKRLFVPVQAEAGTPSGADATAFARAHSITLGSVESMEIDERQPLSTHTETRRCNTANTSKATFSASQRLASLSLGNQSTQPIILDDSSEDEDDAVLLTQPLLVSEVCQKAAKVGAIIQDITECCERLVVPRQEPLPVFDRYLHPDHNATRSPELDETEYDPILQMEFGYLLSYQGYMRERLSRTTIGDGTVGAAFRLAVRILIQDTVSCSTRKEHVDALILNLEAASKLTTHPAGQAEEFDFAIARQRQDLEKAKLRSKNLQQFKREDHGRMFRLLDDAVAGIDNDRLKELGSLLRRIAGMLVDRGESSAFE